MPEIPPQDPAGPTRLAVSRLNARKPVAFRLEPDQKAREALAGRLDAQAVRKLRFDGRVAPDGDAGWRLEATLGATVVQPCIVTLEPVTSRIDTPVTRRFVPPDRFETRPGTESEMPQDDTLDPLGSEIDLAAVMEEALALAMPIWPRKPDASLGDAVFAADGVTPMTDDDAKPFAGLQALRDRMDGD